MHKKWNRAFQDLVEKKTGAALTARIPGFSTFFESLSDHSLQGVGNAWSRRLFDGEFYFSEARSAQLPAVSAVFVQSKDGNTATDNPADLGGGETDHHLVYEGLSRVNADAILSGAETVRGSQTIFSVWHPKMVELRQRLGLPRHPVQMVATRSGRLDMDNELMFNVSELEVVIITGRSGVGELAGKLASRPWVTVISSDSLTESLKQLRSRQKVRRVSLIGGRKLAKELFELGVVQDLYLTTSNKKGGEPGTPYFAGPLGKIPVLAKTSLAPESGIKFEHFALKR